MKYPIELEFTDYCGLKCRSCPNSALEGKSFITEECFNQVLSYIERNIDHIAFLVIAGIGDVFLHPLSCDFFNKIIERLGGKGIDILLPTKGQSVTLKHLDVIKKLMSSGFSVNVGVGIYSLNANLYKELSGGHSLDSIFSFMKKLKENNIRFSFEILQLSPNQKEVEYGKKIASVFGCGFDVQGFHNYGGTITHYDDKDNVSTFDGNKSYYIEGFYCNFVPFIDSKGNVYTCDIGAKQEKYNIGSIDTINHKFPNFEKLVEYIYSEFLGKEKCFNCSFYKNYEKRKTTIGNHRL